MGISQWWLYDLVVVAIAILCIWNGANGGILRSSGSLIIGIVSCMAAAILSGPISEMVYDSFFKETLQNTITKELRDIDITDNIRGRFESSGIYLPYDDQQIADMIEEIKDNDSAVQQAASIFGIDVYEFEGKIVEAMNHAISTNDNIIPSWITGSITDVSGKINIDSASDIAVAVLRDDYANASNTIEKVYIKPAVTGILRPIVFIIITTLLTALLKAALLALPSKKNNSITNIAIGTVIGVVKAILYMYIMVLLVSCISSMQNGEYPFYSRETINQTYLFHIFYDIWK